MGEHCVNTMMNGTFFLVIFLNYFQLSRTIQFELLSLYYFHSLVKHASSLLLSLNQRHLQDFFFYVALLFYSFFTFLYFIFNNCIVTQSLSLFGLVEGERIKRREYCNRRYFFVKMKFSK
jgi:hypothetical protein